MASAQTIVRVGEESVLAERPFVTGAGERCAWLDVGADYELRVYGSPAAMRRLAAAVLATAVAAEQLPERRGSADEALTVAARP